jgi:DNA repair protein RadD
VILRPYQTAAVDRVAELEAAGVSRILLVAPTGAGKTVLAAELIRQRAATGARCLFLAHRRELIRQTSDKLKAIGLRHGVLLGGVTAGSRRLPFDPQASVQVASIQTYTRRDAPGAWDVVICDEAHHVRADSYAGVLADNPTALVLGLTATPWRIDGRGLAEVFDEVVVVAKFRELIDAGFLVPYQGFAYDAPELAGLELAGGDLTERAAARVMGSKAIVGNVVEQWATHARDRRTVIFASSVERSAELVREIGHLRHHGAPVAVAEHVDATTPTEVRDALLDPVEGRLATGETLVVSNVGLLTEGTDVPAIECVVLARPTLSTALALQCMGRGFRLCPEIGKIDLLIHDHAGVSLMHGRPDDDRTFDLQADSPRVTPGERAPGVVACRSCSALLERGESVCWFCETPTARRRRGPRTVEASRRVAFGSPPEREE